MAEDVFGAGARLESAAGAVRIYRLDRVVDGGALSRLPYSLRVLLENAVRATASGADPRAARALADWRPGAAAQPLEFLPARVLLQDLTGVPLVVDLAGLRAAVAERGGDPGRINPVVPVDLVIDHSVHVDAFGTADALSRNVELEYGRNRERYLLLRWAQGAFDGLRVVPPGTGIVHQVNLEYLADVVAVRSGADGPVAMPDTVVGTDSHTTMVNGLGVLGWGVGGIEAEAVMLGEPYPLALPEVVGVRLEGELPPGSTATDLVLAVTELLRGYGVVGKFVEFAGSGLDRLPLPDRATIANMAPEYGATVGFFPVDAGTLAYLRLTGRAADHVDLVERYCKEQGLFRAPGAPDPEFSACLSLDLGTVRPCVAGPRRPQDRLSLGAVPKSLRAIVASRPVADASQPGGRVAVASRTELRDGAVAIAAITSCTNTSNPSVMVAAGLLARNAVARGLRVPAFVKTSLAPGSRVVTDYLRSAGLLEPLEALGFAVVGYGCTTCIGNSGALTDAATRAVREDGVTVAAVLSGNRNFEGRVNPLVRANYLASPPLVVAYALAGTVDLDLDADPLGVDAAGRPVLLRELWPGVAEVAETVARVLQPGIFRSRYSEVFGGDDHWRELPVPRGRMFDWDADSTYVRRPPFYTAVEGAGRPFAGARALALLGDSITTDHISPAGAIAADSDAGRYLQARGVAPTAFNSYGARRGNHEVMVRGTLGNIRLRNAMVPDTEGPYTLLQPEATRMTIFEAAQRYAERGTPLVVIAGRDYGTGSSRDWAAKGVALLGVRAVIAEGFERIHRSNLVGMGVLPLELPAGVTWKGLGWTGCEEFDVAWEGAPRPGLDVRLVVRQPDGTSRALTLRARIDSATEAEYMAEGGILPRGLRRILG